MCRRALGCEWGGGIQRTRSANRTTQKYYACPSAHFVKKNRCFVLLFFASFRLSLHVFHSKRALVGHAPAATALGVEPGEQGGSPETHLGDGSGGRGVCLGSRAVRPRLCVGGPPCRRTGPHFSHFRVCLGLDLSKWPVGRFGSPSKPPSP